MLEPFYILRGDVGLVHEAVNIIFLADGLNFFRRTFGAVLANVVFVAFSCELFVRSVAPTHPAVMSMVLLVFHSSWEISGLGRFEVVEFGENVPFDVVQD